MAEIITNLHPDGDENTNLYPNIKKENIPSKSISTDKLDDNVLSLIGSLKPSGTDTSANILAYTSNKGIYVATDNGHWYYWNGSAYADGGVYQSSEDIEKIKGDITNETSRAISRENEIESLFSAPTQEAVNTWLNEHPEATTTVQDWSLTNKKLVKGTLGYVIPQMFGVIGNGEDETTKFQDALTYVATNHLNLIVPSGMTIVVTSLLLSDSSNFALTCFGTIKRADNSDGYLLKFSNCSDFSIPIINMDGNITNNTVDSALYNNENNSLELRDCTNVDIGVINEVETCKDTIYINNVDNLTIQSVRSVAKNNSGRNAVSIIKGSNIFIDNVYSYQIGITSMPGGVDIEPNNSTDTVKGVKFGKIEVVTSGLSGVAISNEVAQADVSNIDLGTVYVTKTHGTNASNSFTVGSAKNVMATIYAKSDGLYGRPFTILNLENADIKYYGKTFKVSGYLYSTLKNVKITGVLEDVDGYGIDLRCGSSENVLIDMCLVNIKDVPYIVEDSSYGITIKGKVKKGNNTTVDTAMYVKDYVTGLGILFDSFDFSEYGKPIAASGSPNTIKCVNCLGYNFASAKPSTENFYEVGTIVYNTSPSAGAYVGWVCVTRGFYASQFSFKGFGLIEQ